MSRQGSSKQPDPHRSRSPFHLDPSDPTPSGSPLPDPAPGRDRTVRLFRSLASRIARAHGLHTALASVIEELRPFGGWAAGHFFLRQNGAGPFVSGSWSVDDPRRHEALRQASDLGEPEPLIDRVLTSSGSVISAGVSGELGPGRARAAVDAGIRRVHAFPVMAENQMTAVVELFSTDPAELDPQVIEALDFARVLLDQRAGRERAHRAVGEAARQVRSAGERLEPALAQLRAAQERYTLICEASRDGLWDWDLEEDRIHFSGRWKDLLGLGASEITDHPKEWIDRIHPDDSERVERELLEHLEGRSPLLESFHRMLHGDGGFRSVLVRGLAARDTAGKATRVSGSLTDLTDAGTPEPGGVRDLHTGLATNALLLDRIEQAMRRRTRRPDSAFAVIALSLDGYAESLEGLEGSARSELLRAMGMWLSVVARPGDTIGHDDGTGFGLLLEEIGGLDEAIAIFRRIHSKLCRPLSVGRTEHTFTPHVGAVLGSSNYESPEQLLRDAGHALRRAQGEDLVLKVVDSSGKTYTPAVAELESELRHAFAARRLYLEYQPIVGLDDGRITGLEAFLRWDHPERGPIPPDRFLPVAEEAGLISDIGYWVLNRACRQIKEWTESSPGNFPPSIAVNVPEAQLFDVDYVRRTLETIEDTGLDFAQVRLDIREDALRKDGDRAARILEALTECGIRVAIDDFGTGFSSLNHLHRFPVGALKIDRSFVSGRMGKSYEWDVACTIVQLGKSLEIEVIAEGIETREQFLRLRKAGCQQAQGFFFSGPVGPDEAGRMIREGYPLDLTALTG